jgi:16S rRNA (cytosine1402-N4)-methyltransferase
MGMHESVLLKETIDSLDIRSGDVFVDGTLGRAGHSIEAHKRQPDIFILGIDKDKRALDESEQKLSERKANFKLCLGNFRSLRTFLSEAGKTEANKIILDLGVSSPQLDSSKRGFSFREDEPLMMTMEENPNKDSFTAYDIVNGWNEEDIANVIYAYGEERYARRIAKAIVESREENPIKTTHELVAVIERAVPAIYRRGKLHFATRTFQALRIAVNDELGSLKEGLSNAIVLLTKNGRIAVISFHSLEDRIVKVAMKEWEKQGLGKQFTKKPIVPSDEETERNPRSRSAKLRVFIKS